MSFGTTSYGEMKMQNHRKKMASIYAFMIFLTAIIASHGLYAADSYAPMLKAAHVARMDFSARLKAFPAETEHDRFVENIDNYDVGISDNGDSVVVVLRLKRKGGVVKGGGAIYTIRKKDFSILNFLGQE